MSTNPPEGMPRIVPLISYEDPSAASEWLRNAFGFRERLRYTEPDGSVSHVQLELEDGLIMLGSAGGMYVGPRRHAEACEIMRRIQATPFVSDGFRAYVDDVDAHFARAK